MFHELVHSHHEDVLVMRSIENHYFAFAWRTLVSAPKEIVSGLDLARLLEAEDRCPFRVHAAEEMSNHSVLAGGVERLQYDKKGLTTVRVKQVLQLVHAFDMFDDVGCSLLSGLVFACVGRIDLRQTNLRTRLDHELFPIVHSGFPC